MEYQDWCGFCKNGKAEFWLEESNECTTPIHLAFSTENRSQVDAFYAAAIEAGAKDNGAPGIREISLLTGGLGSMILAINQEQAVYTSSYRRPNVNPDF